MQTKSRPNLFYEGEVRYTTNLVVTVSMTRQVCDLQDRRGDPNFPRIPMVHPDAAVQCSPAGPSHTVQFLWFVETTGWLFRSDTNIQIEEEMREQDNSLSAAADQCDDLINDADHILSPRRSFPSFPPRRPVSLCSPPQGALCNRVV